MARQLVFVRREPGFYSLFRTEPRAEFGQICLGHITRRGRKWLATEGGGCVSPAPRTFKTRGEAAEYLNSRCPFWGLLA